MAGETPITVVGNLTADPELKFTPGGDAVANFTVASTPRTFDKQTNEWKDAETLFMRCSIWREAAENVSESLAKGMRVVVTGRLVARSWQTQEGENRTVMEMQVDEIGPSLKYATATVTKVDRRQGGGGGQGGYQQRAQSARIHQATNGDDHRVPQTAYQPGPGGPRQNADPWPAQQQTGGWQQQAAPAPDAPPF